MSALLRTALLLGATVLLIGALLLGMVLATGVVLWALLRGRRPGPVKLQWGRTSARGFGRPMGADTAGEVADVQAREVRGPTLR